MKERWERFLTETQAEKSRVKTAPTAVESFMVHSTEASTPLHLPNVIGVINRQISGATQRNAPDMACE